MQNNIDDKTLMKLPIYKCLELSTVHITASTSSFLREQAQTNDIPELIVYEKGEYGYLIFAELFPDSDKSPLPEELTELLSLAEKNDCDWLILDRDGTILKELPSWEW